MCVSVPDTCSCKRIIGFHSRIFILLLNFQFVHHLSWDFINSFFFFFLRLRQYNFIFGYGLWSKIFFFFFKDYLKSHIILLGSILTKESGPLGIYLRYQPEGRGFEACAGYFGFTPKCFVKAILFGLPARVGFDRSTGF